MARSTASSLMPRRRSLEQELHAADPVVGRQLMGHANLLADRSGAGLKLGRNQLPIQSVAGRFVQLGIPIGNLWRRSSIDGHELAKYGALCMGRILYAWTGIVCTVDVRFPAEGEA